MRHRAFSLSATASGSVLTVTRREDTAATVSIGSISDQDWYISRTHGIYHIPACVKSTPYALLLITSRSDALDLGDNRRFPFTISAREIAEDLLQDLQDHGVSCAKDRVRRLRNWQPRRRDGMLSIIGFFRRET